MVRGGPLTLCLNSPKRWLVLNCSWCGDARNRRGGCDGQVSTGVVLQTVLHQGHMRLSVTTALQSGARAVGVVCHDEFLGFCHSVVSNKKAKSSNTRGAVHGDGKLSLCSVLWQRWGKRRRCVFSTRVISALGSMGGRMNFSVLEPLTCLAVQPVVGSHLTSGPALLCSAQLGSAQLWLGSHLGSGLGSWLDK